MKLLKSSWYWFFSLAWMWIERLCMRLHHEEELFTWFSLLSWWLDDRRFDWE